MVGRFECKRGARADVQQSDREGGEDGGLSAPGHADVVDEFDSCDASGNFEEGARDDDASPYVVLYREDDLFRSNQVSWRKAGTYQIATATWPRESQPGLVEAAIKSHRRHGYDRPQDVEDSNAIR